MIRIFSIAVAQSITRMKLILPSRYYSWGRLTGSPVSQTLYPNADAMAYPTILQIVHMHARRL